LLPNGKVLVAGGQVDGGNALNSAELYDPATGMWTQTGSLNQGRYYHTTTLLPDGKALVVGGFNGNYLAEAELYDPATGAWTQTGSLNTGRYNHTTTLLASGKVLVAGGVNPDVKFDASGLYIGGYLMSAELYDPATGMWTQTGSLNMRRSQHTATLLPDGKVLVAGGYIIKLKDTGDPVFGNLYLDSAELYDPATGTWTQTGSLITGRTEHTATLLPNGKVLVAGGQVQGFGGPAGVTNVAELYDPATGAWTQTGSMTTARRAHTATLLANGKVLAAAGLTKNAELYDTELGFASSSQPVITSAPSHLQLGSKLSLTGTRFQGVSGSSSDNTQSSSTNYPVVRLFSLVDGQTRFLSPDPATNWSSTSFISQAVTDFPKGYALLTVTANGIPSDGRLIRVSGQSQATFSNLSAPTITYGDTPTTLSGKISAASGFPTGSVGITLNGVTQQAAIQPDGTFSSNFNTSTLSTPGSPFTIIYSYGGDATYDGDLDSSKTLRVNKATAAVALSNLSHDFDGAAKFATATTTPSGLTVNISYSQGGSPVSSPTKAGSYDVSAVINDPNYQGSATGTLVINPDTVAPTVTINQAAGQADPTSNSTINFTVIFSEPVSNFSTGDVTFVTNTAGATSAEVTGSDTTYNVAVTGMTADGVIKVSIPAGAATDVADNPNQASTSTDNEVTWKLPAITSSYVVTKTADTNDGACDADCSLREAITQANIIPGKGDITFDLPGAGPHQIQLLTALPALSESVDILNTSGELISVVGRNPVGLFSVFTVNAGQTVNMSRLTIRGGFNGSGGGIIVFGTLNLTDSTVTENIVTNNGGGIYVGPGGTLNLTNSTVSKNIAENNNGTGEGGGIYNGGTLNVTNSTINGNSSHRGAGISNRGTLNLTNSTISGNYANGFLTGNSAPCQFDTQACPGGGIYNSGTLNVTNSTLFQNTAKVSGGIHNAGAATLRGSIVANNRVTDQQDEECCRTFTIGPDLQGSFNSEGFNLIRSTKDATITQTANAGTDLLNVDPNMDGTLADNGGPTLTHRLNPGSPAIDKGKNFSTAATDQRGFLRTADDPSIPNAAGGDGTDIGAFEYGSFEYQPIVVTTAVDELDADSEPGSGTGTSLREAIRYANSLGAGSHLITFAPNLAGQTLMLGSAWSNASDDESTSALVVNGADISIQGPATAPGITLSVAPGENLRHFFVPGTPNTGLTLSNLTLSGGNPQLSGHNFGGAVSAQGPLTVRNCTFTGNSSGAGGAIQSDGGAPSLLVENSTFSGNMSGGHGAAVSSAANQTTFRHLTVTNNTGGSAIALGGAATMVNTIVAGNGDDSFEMGAGGALSAQTTNNICGAATVPGLTNGSNNNLLGVPASPLYLGPLASNGGPTQTHAIGAGSIAINAGVAISGLTTDQRGSERSVGGLPDIGAYEEPTGNGDPDGDSLTNFQEWLIGSDPNSIDSDGDGYNDATEMLAGTNPASASSVPPGTHVERVLGYGPARGLDLTGNFVYAFNVGTNGAVGQAGDANFTDDNAPGITMSAPNQVNPWGAPSFGSTAADDVLENVYKSIRWANSADANPALRKITVDLSGLTVGRRYKLQLLFGEACCNRNFDISVEGSLVADDFKPALAQGSLSLTKTGSAFVHEFVANDTTLNIVLDATNVADPSLDRNPILNGVTLELLAASSAAAAPPSITPAGGSYANSVQVSLVNNSPGTTLRYTTDGSTPTETHGTIYSGPFTLTSSATVKAIAYGGGLQPSAVTSATYTVAANAAPTVSASPNPATTGEGIPVQIALSGTDSDDNNLTFTVTQQPTHGTLSVISTPDCTAVNTCTASVTYTPAAGYSGPDSFKFKANDGAADSNEATVSITVNAVAHLSISDVAKAEGNTGQTAFTFTVSLDSPAPAGGVSFNWSTADGTAAAPGDYTAVTNASGSIAQGNTSTTITVQVKGDAAQEPNETFFVNVSGVTGATVSDAQGQGTILNDDGAPSAGQILISEFRLRGPDPDGAGPLTGSDDEFIELYNNTGSDFVVADSSPLSVAQAGWAIVSSDAPTTAKVVVAAGTTIPARGHFLVANGVGYSLSAYAAADAPGGVPATYNVDIPEGSGLALFRTGNPALFAQPAERLDSVGFASAPPPFFEGTPLQPAGGITAPAEHSFVRKLTSGLPQDTDDNASDFLLVSTTGAKLDGVQSLLGAPGPENLSSLVNRGSKIKAALFDSAKTTADAPNRERTSTPVTNGDAGTLLLRRTFTNNTGATVTALRFRVVKMTAGPGGGAGIADLRLLNTASSTVSITGGGSKTTTNMTLDVSPAQAMGGGMNSTVTASIPDGIAPGSTADIQFTLGVVTPGSFNFFVIVEALPGINGPAGELGGSPGPADLDGSKRGGTTKGSPGKGAPAKSRQ
jgi:CSLREA domain-containing protein